MSAQKHVLEVSSHCSFTGTLLPLGHATRGIDTINIYGQYAKSGRAKCHGACRGSLIPKGALRYGQKYIHEQYGESVSWMHWSANA